MSNRINPSILLYYKKSCYSKKEDYTAEMCLKGLNLQGQIQIPLQMPHQQKY